MTSDIHYLTADGKARLQEELAYLKGPGRDELSTRLRAAIQMGDLSENADYIQAKEEQGFMEGRIQELERILRNVVLIEDVEKDHNIVNIGDHITVDDEGYEETYFLVGPKEADPVNGRISYQSPIGSALLGKKKGEKVTVDTPAGTIKLTIIKIE